MRKGCLIATAGAIIAVVVASMFGVYRLVTTYYDLPIAARELPAAEAQYRRNGLPLVAADLFPDRIPPERNAAPAIRAAIKAMPPKKAEKPLADAAKTKPSAASDGAVAPFTPALNILQRAIGRPRANFGRDWDMGPQTLFPELARLKTLCRAASVRAAQSAARGDDTAALADLTLARQMGLWAGDEPTMISLLVRIANESIALGGLERCLDAAAGAPQRIARYQSWLRQSPPLPTMAQALRGEAFMGVATTRNWDRFGGMRGISSMDSGAIPAIDPTQLRRSGLPEDGKARAFLARNMQCWNDVYRLTNGFQLPPREIAAKMDAFVRDLEERKGLSYTFPRIIMPVFSGAGNAIVQLEARRAVQVGLAEALTAHAQTGRWPAKVSPLDPFTSKPLLVRVKGPQIRIYSVGRDGKDNGGLFRGEPAAKGKIVDEVAVYPPLR